jgi:copper chaperone
MKLNVLGMMCNHCVKRVENALKEAGATNLKVEIGSVEFDGIDENLAKETIEDLGFDIKE